MPLAYLTMRLHGLRLHCWGISNLVNRGIGEMSANTISNAANLLGRIDRILANANHRPTRPIWVNSQPVWERRNGASMPNDARDIAFAQLASYAGYGQPCDYRR